MPASVKTPLRYRVAHAIWRHTPPRVRRGVLQAVMPHLAPRAQQPAPPARPPITVAGLLSTPSGMGRSAETCLMALRQLGLAPFHYNLSHAFNVHNDDTRLPETPPAQPGHSGMLVLHTNAPYVPYSLATMGRSLVAGQRVVGYWAWELPTLPRSWRAALPFLHEIWTPSQFVATAVRKGCRLPVRVVPHCVPLTQATVGAKAGLGLADEIFTVVTVASIASGFARKNILGAIRAFRQAFGNDPAVRLILKLADLHAFHPARALILEAIGDAANIMLVEKALAREAMGHLLSAADVVLSLHRSEGFGLVMAEGMAMGKAVIATSWSGNMDFMDSESAALVPYKLTPVDDPQHIYKSGEQQWAEPDLEAATLWLRRLRDDVALRQRLGTAARAKVEATISLAAFKRSLQGVIEGLD